MKLSLLGETFTGTCIRMRILIVSLGNYQTIIDEWRYEHPEPLTQEELMQQQANTLANEAAQKLDAEMYKARSSQFPDDGIYVTESGLKFKPELECPRDAATGMVLSAWCSVNNEIVE